MNKRLQIVWRCFEESSFHLSQRHPGPFHCHPEKSRTTEQTQEQLLAARQTWAVRTGKS